MKVVTPDQMREIDRRSIEDLGVPGEDLMERAGTAVAAAVKSLLPPAGTEPFVILLAGKGNNGGDALVAGRLLSEKGISTLTFLLAEAPILKGDAALNLDRLARGKFPLEELVDGKGLDILQESLSKAALIVDGIFGTGFKGPARGIAAEVIKLVNQTTRARPVIRVIAIDIPSGLDGETGKVDGGAIRADLTVTMGLPKTGLVRGEGLNYCGRVIVADIGFPPAVIDEVSTNLEVVTGSELSGLIPPPPPELPQGRLWPSPDYRRFSGDDRSGGSSFYGRSSSRIRPGDTGDTGKPQSHSGRKMYRGNDTPSSGNFRGNTLSRCHLPNPRLLPEDRSCRFRTRSLPEL